MSVALVPFVVDDQWGYLDLAGQPVIEPRYQEATPFADDLAWVRVGAQWGAIDAAGSLRVPPSFDVVSGFSEGRARVLTRRQDGDVVCRFVDEQGSWVGPAWASATDVHEGRSLVETLDGRAGIVDRDGAWVVEPNHDPGTLAPCSHGLIGCRRGDLWGYLDRAGTWALEPRFEAVGPWGPRVGAVSLKQKLALVDRGGNLVASTHFGAAELHAFTDDLLRVRSNHHYGWIDHAGRVVVEPELGFAGDFVGEVAMAGNDPLSQGLIDRHGVFLFPPRFHVVEPTGLGLARVYPNELTPDAFGYTTHQGQWVWSPPGLARHWNVGGWLPGCGH